MTTLAVLTVYMNEEIAHQVREAAGRMEHVELSFQDVSHGRPLQSGDLEVVPDVVLFEVDGSNVQDVNDLKRLMETEHEHVVVYVISKHGDIDTLRHLMRAGVKDVFEQPIVAQELVLALTDALSNKRAYQQREHGGKAAITAFVNAKGGRGATTIAVNVAHLLVVNHKASVALIDMDLQFGGAALGLDLEPAETVLRALQYPQRVDATFLDALMTRHHSGLDVLASPVSVTPHQEITQEGVHRVLEAATEHHDYVVVDMARGFSAWECQVLQMADPVVLVMENDLETIRDAKLLLDRLPAMGVPRDRIEVLINRANKKTENISDAQLKAVLKNIPVHHVRNDYQTALKALDGGLPLQEVSKHSHLTKDVAALADYLAAQHGGQQERKKGFFRHLFGGR